MRHRLAALLITALLVGMLPASVAHAAAQVEIQDVNNAPVAVDDPDSTVCDSSNWGGAFPVVEDWTAGPTGSEGFFGFVVGMPCSLLTNDSDPDGDELTFEILSGPSHGVIEEDGTTFGYDPGPDVSTIAGDEPDGQWVTDSFTYRAFDGELYSAPATMRFWVAPINDPPTFTPGPDVSVEEDSGPYEAQWATDISPGPGQSEAGQTVSFEILEIDSDGIFLFDQGPEIDSSGVLRFTPAADTPGLAEITVQARDDGGTEYPSGVGPSMVDPADDTSDPVTFTIVVTAEADVLDDQFEIDEDAGPWLLDVLGNDDPAGFGTFEVTEVTEPSLGSVEIAEDGSALIYTPDPNTTGADSFDYTVTGDLTASVEVIIWPVNDDPTASDDSFTVLEDAQPTVFDVLADDQDLEEDDLTITAKTNGAKGTVQIIQSGNLLRYTTLDDLNGSDSFTYTIDDGEGGTDTGTVNVTITPVNDAPTFTPGADQTWTEDGGARSIAGWATGIDKGPGESGQSVTFPILTNSNPSLFSAGPAVSPAGTLSFTPAPNQHGSATITLRVRDNGGTANGGTNIGATETLVITITPVNDDPTADAESLTVLEDAAATVVPVLTGDADVDGDTLTITAKTNGTKGTVVITGGGTGLTYKPGANKSGSDSFTYTISDGHGGTATATVSVTITPVNDAPNAVNDGAPTVITIPAGGPVVIPVLANDTDPEADILTISAKTNGAKGTVTITGGGTGLTYDPAALATGTDTFTYTVRDPGGLTDTATVLITLLADTTAPTVGSLTERFPAHTIGTSTVLVRLAWAGSDPGSGIVGYQLQVSANGGAYTNVTLGSPTATTVDRTLTLTTGAEYRFRIRATDAAGNTSAYVAWPVLKPVRYEQTTALATYTGTWSNATSASMSGGSGKFASATNRSVLFSFTGRDVAWVASRFTTSGQADVFIDGVKVATVDLDTTTTQYRRLVFGRDVAGGSGAHTLEIRPLGTGRVDIDAFLILR